MVKVWRMKPSLPKSFFLPVLLLMIASFGWGLPQPAIGQELTVLHSFDQDDGSHPEGLIVSDNTLYGITLQGGSYDYGTVFGLNTDGTGFTNMHSFAGFDGWLPYGLTLSGTTLYGVNAAGGVGGGNVFSVNTDGSGFTNLYNFEAFPNNPPHKNLTGSDPDGSLVVSNDMMYGTAEGAGMDGYGTVFALKTNGTGFTILHSFTGAIDDGANPSAALLLSGNILYGTTEGNDAALDDASGDGTVFSITNDGSIFTTLYIFSGSDGSDPESPLLLSGTTLYGTTALGGTFGQGTVFSLSTNGFDFTNLYHFTGAGDGAGPFGSLVLRGNTLYGTTQDGGRWGNGTIFAIKTDGTGFTTLYSFTALTAHSPFPINSDGAHPVAGLTLSGNALYGTATGGGTFGFGTVFYLLLPPILRPSLTIIPSGPNAVLTWPTNADFFLQSTTNLDSSPVWTKVSPAPVVVNGRNTVTNLFVGTPQFFRLSQ
jgi:uncharacterized repeat protein (TIGR03803 family)